VLIAVCVMWPRYATASARSDGLLLLCGGRDGNSVVSFILSAGVISTVVYHKICEPFKHIWLFDHFMILLYPVYMLNIFLQNCLNIFGYLTILLFLLYPVYMLNLSLQLKLHQVMQWIM
jgi:hypothetical protein